ncbi:MAG: rubrerythrin family protein [Clostridia bacterium]|nr:rubrerythrin family protein [Clostridia bacterium]
MRDPHNQKILLAISDDEMKHFRRLRSITGVATRPQKFKIFIFYWMIRILGLTFGIKLLEKSENEAIAAYDELADSVSGLDDIIADEERHETELINMIEEEHLQYTGSIVLGLNDALVELTGALAGYTFAFQNTRLIALTGLITGISASFSMAASEYLSSRQDDDSNALRSAVYTGISYVVTVILLILPFLLLSNPFICLAVTLLIAVLVIFMFNFYVSIAKDEPFKRRFLEMSAISLGVAALSFLIGILIRQFIGIDI